jgi:ankyrin repeat protein
VGAQGATVSDLLHWAAQNGNTGMVTLLLDHGADLGVQNVRGKTAMQIIVDNAQAGKKGSPELIEWLKDKYPERVFDWFCGDS